MGMVKRVQMSPWMYLARRKKPGQMRNQAAEQYADSMMDSMDEGVSMTEVYLAIENPKRVKDQKDNWAAAIAKAKQEGYDGIVYPEQYENIGSDSFIAFTRSRSRV